MKFEWNCFYNRRLVLARLSSFLFLAEFPMKKKNSFSFLSIDLSLSEGVQSDFEIKEFYLTFELEVTYFIHLQANYMKM